MRQPVIGELARVHKPASMYAALNTAPQKPKAIVISGPSGGGKSTILKKLFQQYPNVFAFSISHTTRRPRPGETDGIEYHFTDKTVMEHSIEKGEFLEHAQFGGNLYGTSKKAVKDIQTSGKICILDVDLQGVRSVKKSGIQANYIFVKPPSMKILEERLHGRKTENDDSLRKRLKHAEEDEIAVKADPTLFDHVIINDELETAYKDFVTAIKEQLKIVTH